MPERRLPTFLCACGRRYDPSEGFLVMMTHYGAGTRSRIDELDVRAVVLCVGCVVALIDRSLDPT